MKKWWDKLALLVNKDQISFQKCQSLQIPSDREVPNWPYEYSSIVGGSMWPNMFRKVSRNTLEVI